MLRISKLADYATLVMVHLARTDAQLQNAKEVAVMNNLAVPTVSKLLKLLATSQLLVSQLGAKGGYNLARSANEISLAQIIQAVEGGHSGLTECSHQAGECALEDVCAIRDNWQVISHAIMGALDNVSLAQLAKPSLQMPEVDVSEIGQLGESE